MSVSVLPDRCGCCGAPTAAAGELRSIGSVMIHTDADGHKSIINADEFQRLMTVSRDEV